MSRARTVPLALCATALVAMSPALSAFAEPTPLSGSGAVRATGADRYVVSAEVSKASFTSPQDTVFVASGQVFPDALSGGAAAGKLEAPLLLTARDGVPASVKSEITRLAPKRIYVLGGEGTVSKSTLGALNALAPAQRIGGADRYAVAANIAAAHYPAASTVYLASGEVFADALSGGPAAAKVDAPLLLTGKGTLPAATKAQLTRLKPSRVVILGGTGSVSVTVQSQVASAVPGVAITRHAGADRYAVAANVARAVWPDGASTAFYASGTVFADGLSGTPAAAVNGAPLLLSTRTCMPAATVTADKAINPALRVFVGGPASVSTTTTGCGTTAQAVLNTLPVKGRAPKTGYDRDQFGTPWTDNVTVQGGHNGCDTRNDVLRRDLTNTVLKADSNGCTVLSGTLQDPYSGKTINFVRGTTTSSAVQIDHIVALSNAWQTGAQQLTLDKRKDLANDPLNLWAVDGPLNSQKGDGDAATWLPPAKSIRCLYVAKQVAVKKAYNLWVTAAEKDAITAVLNTCSGQQLPTSSQWATPAPR